MSGSLMKPIDLTSLAEAIRLKVMESLRVALPAIVVAYDPATRRADLQPAIIARYEGAGILSLPVMTGVPIMHPRTSTGELRLPVSVGDIATVIISDRSLNDWLGGDGTPVEPDVLRYHNLADAWAILGGWPDNANGFDAGSPENAVFAFGDAQIHLTPDGKLKIGSAGTHPAAARTDDATVANNTTDQPPSNGVDPFFVWLSGLVSVITTVWVPVPADGGAALKVAMSSYISGHPVPTALIGKITGGSGKVSIE